MDTPRRLRLRDLIESGKKRGYLTYAEVMEALPDDITDPEQIREVISMLNDLGIEVEPAMSESVNASEFSSSSDRSETGPGGAAKDGNMRPNLKVGGTYFWMNFEDYDLTLPLIETYVYLGKDLDGEPADPDHAGYSFRIVGSDNQVLLTEAQISLAMDIDALIQRLNDFRAGKIR